MNDPAVLFYTSDFLTGVMDMTMEERGQYITLLCYQHQRGHIKEETIRLLVGSCSINVLNHFKIDNEGYYYNERMDVEIEKRLNFTASRRENGKKGGRPKKPSGKPKKNLVDNHMDNHMGNLMGNDNENININKNIIEYLNNKLNSNYKYTTRTTKEKINARLNDGYTYEDFVKVIDKKYNEWVGTEFEKYLCPETLFGTKFEKYLNQKEPLAKKEPEWLNKEQQQEIATEEEQNEINEFLKDFN